MVFRHSDVPFAPRDPTVTAPCARRRFSGQCARMIQLLLSRPVSNKELAGISLKYTSRISDLREYGYLIVCTEDPAKNGVCWYTARDLRRSPRPGYSLAARGESREIVKVETKNGRTWICYRTPRRMGVTRVSLHT